MRRCLHLRIEHIIGSMDKLQVRFTQDEARTLVLVLKHAADVVADDTISDAAHRFAVHLEDRMLRYWHPGLGERRQARLAPPLIGPSAWNGETTRGNT